MRHASQPPTFEAYTEFVAGVELATHGQHREALPHFLAAVALDSNFTMASLWAASAYGMCDEGALRDSIGQALNRRHGQLAPLDRLLLDFQLASYRLDHHSALEAMRRFVEIAPQSNYLKFAGEAALKINHPREAVEFLTQADPESGWLPEWSSYWANLTSAYHALGDHKRELEAGRRARQQYPDDPRVRRYVIPALAALGRIDEVNALIEEAQVLGPKGAPADVMWQAAGELRAHGYRAAGMQMLQRRIEWLESRPPEERQSVALRGKLGTSLMLVGRLDEARKLIEEWLEGWPDNEKLGILAHLAAREGRPEEVLRISRVVDSIPRRLGGIAKLNDLWGRTVIAVALDDRERAMELLRERGYVGWLRTQFQLKPLWNYPPFQELLRPKG